MSKKNKMTIGHLIEKLQSFPKELRVYFKQEDDDQDFNLMKIEEIVKNKTITFYIQPLEYCDNEIITEETLEDYHIYGARGYEVK